MSTPRPRKSLKACFFAALLAFAPQAGSEPGRHGAGKPIAQPPVYPPESHALGEEGLCLVKAHVGADGRPSQIRLERSSGHRRLDQAALSAVAGWRFVPARQGGKPVESWVIVPVEFRLQNEKSPEPGAGAGGRLRTPAGSPR